MNTGGAEQQGRAAIYARISLDRQGAGLGVQRQIEDCEQLAGTRRLRVVATYSDNDVSAYSGRHRPGYRQLLDDVRRGRLDVVITWHADRLHRSPRELEEWIEACEREDVLTLTVRAGELDLSTAAGRMVARMLGAAARHESEQKSERVRRARQQAAAAGRPNGNLGYGYNPDHTVNPVQAQVIRSIADRILAGETLYAIATDLNERKVPSPADSQWRTGNMRTMIMRGALCGWREWDPGGRGHARGSLVAEGTWTPILTRATTERLRAFLQDPSRRRGRVPSYLLSGILVCGRCDSRLSGSINGGTRRYGCNYQPGLSRCGRCTVVAEPVEDLVREAVLAALVGAKFSQPAASSEHDARAIAEIDDAHKKLNHLAEEYASSRISRSEWTAARRVIMERVDAAQGSLALPNHQAVLGALPTDQRQIRRFWQQASTESQRAIFKALIERVVVQPAGRGGNRFNPSRIETPVWRA